MAGLLSRLGRCSARRHWLVIIAWGVIMGIAGVTYTLFAGTISSSITIPNAKTSQVQDELADKFPEKRVSLPEYLDFAEQLVHHLEGHHGM